MENNTLSKPNQKEIADGFFTLSDNFLQLVENVLSQTITQGNVKLHIGGIEESAEERSELYRNKSNWSNFRILISTLFNFFMVLNYC